MSATELIEIEDSQNIVGALARRSPNVQTAIVVGARSARTPVIGSLSSALVATLPSARIVEITSRLPCLEELPHLEGVEQFVAVGGGKVMDISKLLSLSLSCKEIEARLAGNRTNIARRSRLVCIPTTAGSGSEATHFAVCYWNATKYSIAHPSIRPDVALLCPDLLRELPPRQLAISALDAVAQAIESLFSGESNDESSGHAWIAVTDGLPALRAIAKGASHPGTYACLQRAAYSAGRAIDIAKTNLPHALSYHLTMRHSVPHGLAVALLFEAYLCLIDRAQFSMSVERRDDARRLFQLIGGRDQYIRGRWTALLRDLGLPASISALGVAVDRHALVSSVNRDRLQNLAFPVVLEDFVATAIATRPCHQPTGSTESEPNTLKDR